MDVMEKELEDRLREMGKRLAAPSSDVHELLRLLDQTEVYLSRVEQSPSASMSDVLHPLMSLLVAKELLKHPEADVKVSVTACINEITRITAPDAPYNDDLMKEIFAMIVDAFGKLDNMSGFSYSKIVCILETVAKVRSCVVMLDLECDDLILQMFKHFMKSIRQDHSVNVFSSMETIMTLVLEESEEISQELLICLLSNLQLSKKGVMPVAYRLAEKVVSNSAMKLKPCLPIAVQSMGAPLSDYSGIVASIIQESSTAPKVDDHKLSERTDSDELVQESGKLDKDGSCLEEVASFSDNARKTISNGVIPARNGSPFTESISPELKHEHSCASVQFKNDIGTKGEKDDVKLIGQKHGSELILRHMEGKSPLGQAADVSDSSQVDGDKEAFPSTSKKDGRQRETEIFLEPVGGAVKQIDGLVGDNAFEKSEAPSEKTRGRRPKRGRAPSSKSIAKKGLEDKAAFMAGKNKMSNSIIDKKCSPTKVSDFKKGHDSVSNSDEKQLQDSAKKSLEDHAGAFEAATATKDSRKSTFGGKADARRIAEAGTSGKQRKYNIKQSKGRDIIEKLASIDNVADDMDVLEEPCLKEMIASSKVTRAANSDHKRSVKDPQMSSSKKLLQGKDVLSETQLTELELNEDICGSMIEVWWPDDKQFYSGVIESFDQKTRKHKIVYDDGDVEVLLLKNERWKYIKRHVNANSGVKQEDIKGNASPESSLHLRAKKALENSGKNKQMLQSGSRSDGRFKGRQTSGASLIEFKGRATRKASKYENAKTSGDERNKVENFQTNNSDVDTITVKPTTSTKVKTDPKFNGQKALQTGDSMSVKRSKGRPKIDSWRTFGPSDCGTKTLPKDGVVVESSQTSQSDDETHDTNFKGKTTLHLSDHMSVVRSEGKTWKICRSPVEKAKTMPRRLVSPTEEGATTLSKDAGVAVESSETNDSDDDTHDAYTISKVKTEKYFKGRRSLPLDDGIISSVRSPGRPKIESKGTKVLPSDGVTMESSQTTDFGDDIYDARTTHRVESDQKLKEKKGFQLGDGISHARGVKALPNDKGKSVLKSRGRRRGPTSKIDISSTTQVLKSPNKDEVKKAESFHANCSDDTKDAMVVRSKDRVVSFDEKLNQEDELKVVDMSGDDQKAGSKRKATSSIDTATDANAATIRKKRGVSSVAKKPDAVMSQIGATKSKRRRRK
ncbi:hypothetical protein HPP92_020436 [Vanilla planifolia]|uniref:Uncharacterized protein n=1 Tax=Vanilla planifolia TaxID=51239 RepID=A0A835QAQ4_VANPL|nr:hypothetical protein HPP92_020436 [Vanilla planifolia]